MKQLCSCLVCLILIIQARVTNAQSPKNNTGSWRYTASSELMVPPISTLNESNNMGYGLNLETEYFLNKAVAVALKTGYDYFPCSLYYYYPLNPNARNIKIYNRGIPFQIIPLMAGIHYYPAKWFYLSGSAGLVMGGSEGQFKVAFGYEPEIGFLIPVKKSNIIIGLKFLYSNLRVENALNGKRGGLIEPQQYDFAQAMEVSVGWKF